MNKMSLGTDKLYKDYRQIKVLDDELFIVSIGNVYSLCIVHLILQLTPGNAGKGSWAM